MAVAWRIMTARKTRYIFHGKKDFAHYTDYAQETLRQIIAATGHQQRLAREGMVMKNGIPPTEDAVKQERLIAEIASGIKMLEMGLPARLSDESVKLVDYWNRELKENPLSDRCHRERCEQCAGSDTQGRTGRENRVCHLS